MTDVTQLIQRISDGEPEAADELLPLVYQELRILASARMSKEQAGQTLQATALVHEAWLRLTKKDDQVWNGRPHFFAAAAEAMRRILVERARRRLRIRHGGQWRRAHSVDLSGIANEGEDVKILAVHEALETFAVKDPKRAEVVKLRFFVGMEYKEIASVMELSEPTVKRYWAFARAWLLNALSSEPSEES